MWGKNYINIADYCILSTTVVRCLEIGKKSKNYSTQRKLILTETQGLVFMLQKLFWAIKVTIKMIGGKIKAKK